MNKENTIKQVIVIRSDLNMRRGKEAAQVAHASMKVFFDKVSSINEICNSTGFTFYNICFCMSEQMKFWAFNNSFTKVVVSCNSEEELFKLQKQSEEVGIVNAIIIDEGRTEFNNIKTPTCLAIGPDYSEKIDIITGHLKLR